MEFSFSYRENRMKSRARFDCKEILKFVALVIL
jgi:hypothetical protein